MYHVPFRSVRKRKLGEKVKWSRYDGEVLAWSSPIS